MPYCPQCGSEYTEGIATCHECGVELVAERPERVRPPREPRRALVVLSSIGSRFIAGFQYAWEAARLLWGRPGLLWLPLLVVLFNAAEITVTNLLYFTATEQGRELAQEERRAPSPEAAQWMLSMGNIGGGAARGALSRQHAAVQGPELRGTRMLISRAADQALSRARRYGAMLWLALYLSLILSAPLIALFRAGYYGMLRAAVGGEPGRRGLFAASVRARYWAFLGYEAVLVAAGWAVRHIYYLVPYHSPLGPALYGGLNLWGESVILLLLAVGFVAITLDGVGPLKGVGRSARTVVRDFPVLLVLLVTTFALLLPANSYGAVASYRLYSSHGYLSPFGIVWGGMLGIAIGGLNVVIGVWLALAQFLWYRAANPLPTVAAAEEGPGATPAEAEGQPASS